MTKQLGPTFGDDIRASGPVLPISWGATDDTIFGRDSLSAEDNARLDEVIAAHDPALTAVPQTISRRQFYQALAELGHVTEDAAKHAMTDPSYVLSTLKAQIGALAVEDQFAVEMRLLGAVIVYRADSMIADYLAALGLAPRQIDDLFRHAATV